MLIRKRFKEKKIAEFVRNKALSMNWNVTPIKRVLITSGEHYEFFVK